MELITFLIAIALGILTMRMAEKRGRDKWYGLVAGMLFGILAILYYLVVGNAKKELPTSHS